MFNFYYLSALKIYKHNSSLKGKICIKYQTWLKSEIDSKACGIMVSAAMYLDKYPKRHF